jgi:allophanate hydrolase
MDFSSLRAAYASGRTPRQVLAETIERINSYDDPAVWIDRLSDDEVMAQVERVKARKQQGLSLPLYGLPFAVKDNIDVASHDTTAACPAFSYRAAQSSPGVQRAIDAGAILVGKTNLDQLASGLVGIRSPYGVPRNPFDARAVPGGSSSGSAVAVAAGLVSFALGTDTAGSGRVPAAFNNVVGLKPTRGLISTTGVVPACRSLDCVSVFALTCSDAAAVLQVAAAFDSRDVASHQPTDFLLLPKIDPDNFRFGVPPRDHLRFFGNNEAADLYAAGLKRLESLGGKPVEIDFSPFAAAGQLLYQGPWVVERLEAAAKLLTSNPEAILPVTRKILGSAARFTATDALAAVRQLRALCRAAETEWARMDVLALPTAGTIYSIPEVEADPITLNANLGYYTHFANLMDLCAISVPSGFQTDGLPVGLMLLGQAGRDEVLTSIGGRYHQATGLTLGATGIPQPPSEKLPSMVPASSPDRVRLAVMGAHLSGQPLNHQLLTRQAKLVRSCRTAGRYRLYALAGTVPPKPGLLRVAEQDGGMPVDVEVWEMTAENFGTFVASIPPPLGIGTIELEDGTVVKGFICEPYAIANARDITHHGGWRQYLQAMASESVSST